MSFGRKTLGRKTLGQISTFDKPMTERRSRILHIRLVCGMLKAVSGLGEGTHPDRSKTADLQARMSSHFHFLVYTLLYSVQ